MTGRVSKLALSFFAVLWMAFGGVASAGMISGSSDYEHWSAHATLTISYGIDQNDSRSIYTLVTVVLPLKAELLKNLPNFTEVGEWSGPEAATYTGAHYEIVISVINEEYELLVSNVDGKVITTGFHPSDMDGLAKDAIAVMYSREI